MTQVVVGLGNPGPQYRGTRHNLGFAVVQELERRYGVRGRRQGPCVAAIATVAGEPVALSRPTTFMNRSGQAVVYLIRRYRVTDFADLLVVADDMDLPLGTLRMRSGGGDAGHNGVRSIIDALGTQPFPRLRLGVGRPPVGQDPVEYVLGRFRRDERPAVAQAVAVASDAIECWLESGLEAAMNRFNRALPADGDPP